MNFEDRTREFCAEMNERAAAFVTTGWKHARRMDVLAVLSLVLAGLEAACAGHAENVWATLLFGALGLWFCWEAWRVHHTARRWRREALAHRQWALDQRDETLRELARLEDGEEWK